MRDLGHLEQFHVAPNRRGLNQKPSHPTPLLSWSLGPLLRRAGQRTPTATLEGKARVRKVLGPLSGGAFSRCTLPAPPPPTLFSCVHAPSCSFGPLWPCSPGGPGAPRWPWPPVSSLPILALLHVWAAYRITNQKDNKKASEAKAACKFPILMFTITCCCPEGKPEERPLVLHQGPWPGHNET